MDPKLHELERRIAEFNILEALGVVRHELRHSDFLAFLLDPAGKHGMGDYFLKRFLQAVILSSVGSVSSVPASGGDLPDNHIQSADIAVRVPISPVELDVWSLDNAQVYRELYHIDLLV